MSVSFFAVDPQHTDGTNLSLVPDALSESTPRSKSVIVIWRLVATHHGPPYGLYLPVDKALVVDALSILFPQLSTSSPTGPNLERIESCLVRDETFTLLLATETTSHVYFRNEDSSSSSSAPLTVADAETLERIPRISLKITRIVGCLTLITLKLLMKSRAHIEDLVVLTDCRGQGIGRGLMQRAIDEAVDMRGCTMVDLTSRPDRAQARALYESLGFSLRDTGVFRYTAPTPSPE